MSTIFYSKVAMSNNFEGSHCLGAFDISEKTIIRYDESRERGAKFLNETEIDTFEYCLKYCCDTRLCNLAVWDEKVSSKSHLETIRGQTQCKPFIELDCETSCTALIGA
jgi:hypothetical protein